MKFIRCTECTDIIKLFSEPRSCKCGKSSGRYTDKVNAVYSGPAIPIGFGNNSFDHAIQNQPFDGVMGLRFYAFVIPKNCETFRKVKEIK